MDLNELKSVLVNPHSLVEMKFLLQEQKYLECLEDGRVFEALDVLRKELTPLGHNVARVHQLSSFMMCSSDDELRKAAHWQGKGQLSRGSLMERLQRFQPPSIMLPPRRYHFSNTLITLLLISFPTLQTPRSAKSGSRFSEGEVSLPRRTVRQNPEDKFTL
mgnify:CR=1 FL=1